jgi:hypothetical protein
MKKLIITSSLILILGFFSCKKETVTSTSQEEIATGKPPSSPPPTSILQWQKCFGSSADDIGNSIAINSTNDAYFICGNTMGNDGNVTGNHGGQDAWLVKTRLDGFLLWQVAIGGASSDQANAVVATADDGCLVAGAETAAGAVITKISATGTIEWAKTLEGDMAYALINTTDGGFAIAGRTAGNLWLLKLDNTANVEWQTTYLFEGAKSDVAYSLTQTSDGEYVIAGRTLSIDNNPDICVVKVNSAGIVNWAKRISSPGGDVAFGVTASPGDGGCVVTGYLGSYNLLVEKLDIDGELAWQKTFAGSTASGHHGRAILSTSEGYIVTGRTDCKNGDIIASKGGDDMFVLQLGLDGNKISSHILGGKGNDIGRSLVATPDGAYMAAGQTSSNNGDVSGNHGGSDVWMVKFKF